MNHGKQLIHKTKSASATVCGLPTYEPPINLGVLTTDPTEVTCPACKPKKYWQDLPGDVVHDCANAAECFCGAP